MATVTDARIKVRVGETVFHTTKATLIESQLFASLFALSPPEDDEYFVDNDPELFTHVLRYLRTKLYPLFYDRASGHDKVMYSALLQQAEFYQIPSLTTWFSERNWLQAVRKSTKRFSHSFVGKGQMANMHAYWARDEELTVTSVNTTKQKKIKCPRDIWEHDGNMGACTRHGCYRVGSTTDPIQPMQILEIEGFLTKVEVLQDLLRRERVDSSEVIVAAMQNPPPYQPGDGEAPLPTQPLSVTRSSNTGGRGGGGSSVAPGLLGGIAGASAGAPGGGAGGGGG
jgi:hypothetical protein